MRNRITRTDDGWRIPDALWERVQPLLPEKPAQPKGGRPWTDDRRALDGIFYLLRTGCQWKALPREFGAPSTVHDRFVWWSATGVFARLWRLGLEEYDVLVGLDWTWQAMDGAMTKAPLGGRGGRAQSHRSGQGRDQVLPADGGPGPAGECGGGRRQSARHEAGGAHPGGPGHRAA